MGGTFSGESSTPIQAAAGKFGLGHDLDEAVIAATNHQIDQEGQLVTTVTLSVACDKLPNLDTFSKSDAMCVLYQFQNQKWIEIGKSEVIKDTLDPRFIKGFQVEYRFEERQKFKMQVYDVDDHVHIDNLEGHDFIGELEFMLHEVVTARNQILKKPLLNSHRKGGNNGTITLTAEENSGAQNELLDFEMRCILNNHVATREDQVFFIISRFVAPEQYVPVYKSEDQKFDMAVNANKWNRVKILTSILCKEEPDREIRVDFYQFNKSGNHKFLGMTTITLQTIKNQKISYDLHNYGSKVGQIQLNALKFDRRHTFLDYVFGGCEISLSVAIDFTLSNGDPKDPQSLHYFDQSKNEYLQAIQSVGQILQYYDSDKKIPAFGFGAQVPPVNHRATHCFAINGDIFNPECDGVEGVVEAYRNAINNINFYGPTYFSQVIKMAVDLAESERVNQANQKYYILLLLTDGIINDMKKTISEIVRGSSLPLSIIIVGVGNEDFSSMQVLDADEEPLYCQVQKKVMERDIVQFVPFRKFKNNPVLLAKETLNEVPNQLLSFMDKKGIIPKILQEEEKNNIKKKLSRASTLNSEKDEPYVAPEFFREMKEKFLQQCQDMGMDFLEVSDFIETKFIAEANHEIIIDHIKNPAYTNKLRINRDGGANPFARASVPNHRQSPSIQHLNAPPKKQAAGYNYDYFDPGTPNQGGNKQRKGSHSPSRSGSPSHKGSFASSQQQQSNTGNIQKPTLTSNDCAICLANQIDTVLVPCGHACVCEACSKKIKNTCPMCRKQVSQVVKVFTA